MATTTQSPLSEDQIDRLIESMADSYGQQARSPILQSPAEQGLDFEEISFQATDGVPIEGWFIPAAGSDKLIIANHPRGFSRAGMPSHLEPWKSVWERSGNGFEIDFLPDYKILHDAGYNVLTYDLRNHGHSSAANGGIVSSGLFESRDVLGSLRYARERQDTSAMTVGLFSRCLGANSTMYAMAREPRAFDSVRCLVACQPLTPSSIARRLLILAGVPDERVADSLAELDRRMVLRTSISFAQRDVKEWAKTIRTPTFIYQVRDDILTTRDDVQTIFDNLSAADKDLLWIENSTARWDGYAEFQRRPTPMLQWFATHLG
ncbi:alpha/beta hydrolase family protein [Amycolatopsis pithecellobii]|uniref:Alpha/beta hydrolase n=1 Tax=Amycolatopsis pithecellobii TaxID=664692 RepID=A0A6N7Z551_9PSEU|nr:alpha/beta hydrolase [Amycolatopsis pithecellobii]MTD55634.1 alpha/beta hydrolase [Amycolatopsis pithecellobii]